MFLEVMQHAPKERALLGFPFLGIFIRELLDEAFACELLPLAVGAGLAETVAGMHEQGIFVAPVIDVIKQGLCLCVMPVDGGENVEIDEVRLVRVLGGLEEAEHILKHAPQHVVARLAAYEPILKLARTDGKNAGLRGEHEKTVVQNEVWYLARQQARRIHP